MAMTVKEHVLDAVRRENLFPPGCTVVVGFSGGADSVTLLHILHVLREELDLSRIVAVHIDHQLRGEESQRDKTFAEAFCRELDISFSVYTYDVQKLADEAGKGIEEMGRELRYHAFNQVAQQYSPVRIATAHNADDHAETVLLHMCRGCGIHGLIGIQAVRGNLVRPLMDCSRSEIEAYCRENALDFVNDSSNADISYSRNRVRHRVLPELRMINPAVNRSIWRLAEQARETEAFLDREADKRWNALLTEQEGVYQKAPLLSADPVIQRVLLRKMIALAGTNAEERHIMRIREALSATGAVTLPQNFSFRILSNTVSVLKISDTPVNECVPVTIGESVVFAGISYRIAMISRKEYEQKLNNRDFRFKNCMDCDMISGELFLRSRRAGDAYRPAGRGCDKSLKKLFNETAVPPERRNTLPILCDEQGIVIPFSFPCDQRVRVTEGSNHILVFEKVKE